MTNTCMTCDKPVLIPAPTLDVCTCAVPKVPLPPVEEYGIWEMPHQTKGVVLTEEQMNQLLYQSTPRVQTRTWFAPTLDDEWLTHYGTASTTGDTHG